MTETSVRTWEGTSLPTPGTFVLEPDHTTVGFVARHLMVTKVRGTFTDFTGSITVADDALATNATFTAELASITTGSEQRDGHLRSPDFFKLEQFPQMTYVSTGITHKGGADFIVVGDLSINGVTKPVSLNVTIEGVAKDPWGGERLALSAKGDIDREDFDVTWNVALESGGVLVSKKIVIEIDAQAVRQA